MHSEFLLILDSYSSDHYCLWMNWTSNETDSLYQRWYFFEKAYLHQALCSTLNLQPSYNFENLSTRLGCCFANESILDTSSDERLSSVFGLLCWTCLSRSPAQGSQFCICYRLNGSHAEFEEFEADQLTQPKKMNLIDWVYEQLCQLIEFAIRGVVWGLECQHWDW